MNLSTAFGVVCIFCVVFMIMLAILAVNTVAPAVAFVRLRLRVRTAELKRAVPPENEMLG